MLTEHTSAVTMVTPAPYLRVGSSDAFLITSVEDGSGGREVLVFCVSRPRRRVDSQQLFVVINEPPYLPYWGAAEPPAHFLSISSGEYLDALAGVHMAHATSSQLLRTLKHIVWCWVQRGGVGVEETLSSESQHQSPAEDSERSVYLRKGSDSSNDPNDLQVTFGGRCRHTTPCVLAAPAGRQHNCNKQVECNREEPRKAGHCDRRPSSSGVLGGPVLPYHTSYTFADVTKTDFRKHQTVEQQDGLTLPCPIRQNPTTSLIQEIDELSTEAPAFSYGSFDKNQYEAFIPAHVALDKKVLRFFAYFTEDILHSFLEDHRVRPVIIYYYLDNDSMSITEPRVENSGIPQGQRVCRQHLVKNERGEHYHWKDFNLGMDLMVHGIKYHIVQCDAFTKQFMERKGIVLNKPEPMLEDPYTKQRQRSPLSYRTPSDYDHKHQFLTMDGKVLHFFAMWDDTDSAHRYTWPVTIQYYLVDDKVEIREVHKPNSGRDLFPIFLRRQKLPKAMKPESKSFPSCVLEISPEEVQEYYSPKDFQVGQKIELLGRCYLLYNCDGFTRDYYQKNYPDIEMNVIPQPEEKDVLLNRRKETPPYNGFGSLEDSLQTCLSVIPKRPKTNVLKMLENSQKVLRYSAKLDSQKPQDEGRCFVLSYFLSNGTISIFEKSTRNSGIIAGKYLKKTRVPKPGSTIDNPEFYSPADFVIGSTVDVFGQRFMLTDADLYVLKYLESISNQIPFQTLDSLCQKMCVRKHPANVI
ncbi:EF-hand domain-containing protein 1-like [Aulostomus maculatus]